MACRCKNEDGTLSDVCHGACIKSSIVKQRVDASREPLNGFAELILSQVDQRIKNHINIIQVKLEKEKIDTYKEAFLDGLKKGISIGKNFNDY